MKTSSVKSVMFIDATVVLEIKITFLYQKQCIMK